MEKEKKMGLRDKLYLGKVYAARGYVSLVGWLVTIGTFVMVFYGNIIEIFPVVETIFINVFWFLFVSIPIGLIFLAFLGRWDYKKGTFPKEGRAGLINNPEWLAMRKDVAEIKELLIEIQKIAEK